MRKLVAVLVLVLSGSLAFAQKADRIQVGTPGNATPSQNAFQYLLLGDLTKAPNPVSGRVVHIGDRTYTFNTVWVALDGFVKIQSTAAETIAALIDCINKTGDPTERYYAASAHPVFRAQWWNGMLYAVARELGPDLNGERFETTVDDWTPMFSDGTQGGALGTPCQLGDVRVDNVGFIYLCTAPRQWKRVGLSPY